MTQEEQIYFLKIQVRDLTEEVERVRKLKSRDPIAEALSEPWYTQGVTFSVQTHGRHFSVTETGNCSLAVL
jgi:hypothetical protein